MSKTKTYRPYLLLWILCIVGSIAVVPYLFSTGIISQGYSYWKVTALLVIQSAIIFGILCIISAWLVKRIDFSPFSQKVRWKDTIVSSFLVGAIVGLFLYVYTMKFPSPSLLDKGSTVWIGFLASIFGGINEEVLSRLFLFSLLYYLLKKCIKLFQGRRFLSLWTVNILVAILFAIFHLPSRMEMITPGTGEVFSVLFANVFASLVFGYLYWTKGFWFVMFTHFFTDVVYCSLLVW